MTTRWQDEAACLGADIRIFFPDNIHTGTLREALSYCQRCPVVRECLTESIAGNERFGVWGGMSTRQRMELIQPDRYKRLKRKGCGDAIGTTTGYHRHIKAHQQPCEPCSEAMKEYKRRWYSSKEEDKCAS